MKDEELREKFLSSEDIYPGKIIRVQRWQVELPNGQTALREVVPQRRFRHRAGG